MVALAVDQCSSFVKHLEWIPAMYFVAMFECCSMFILLHLDGYVLYIADRCHICFCLPFPNRASDSGVLYIDFNQNHLTFPVALLDFQVEARFNHSLSNHAYASHTASRISSHVPVLVVYYVVCFFSVLLLRVGSGNVACVRTRLSTSVYLLHGLVLLPCRISGKMIIPSKSLLSLLASCSLFCYAYAAIPTTCLSCLPYC